MMDLLQTCRALDALEASVLYVLRGGESSLFLAFIVLNSVRRQSSTFDGCGALTY